MADSDAVRSRRYRRHRQGDHSMCQHRLVPGAGLPLAVVSPPAGEFDPVVEMRALAARLAAVHVAQPGNAAAARELRATLTALMTLPGEDPVDPLDELRAMMSG